MRPTRTSARASPALASESCVAISSMDPPFRYISMAWFWVIVECCGRDAPQPVARTRAATMAILFSMPIASATAGPASELVLLHLEGEGANRHVDELRGAALHAAGGDE